MVNPITVCRVCQSKWLKTVMDFGHMPLANRYLTAEMLAEPEVRAPLDVVLCKNCGCVQLGHTVDPSVLFSEYFYTSSTSGSLALHFSKYAKDTVDKLNLKPGQDFIVGIGGNDGPLERAYQSLGFEVLNVEASANISALSMANRVPTLNAWFNQETAETIVKLQGHASLVTCNNCFAHMPDIHKVVHAIQTLLKPGGWFVCEEGYWLDAVTGNHFDRIYHEHVFYWTVRALNSLFHQHGLDIFEVEHNNSQGGSIRVFVKQDDGIWHPGVQADISLEEAGGLFNELTYAKWMDKIKAWQDACCVFLVPLETVCCYGAPAKFTMLSEQLGFDAKQIVYAVEDSPIKVGRFTPGSHIPIVNREHFIAHPTEHCIITAANYADLIIKNNPQYKGRWVVLTPNPRFV
jgi:SAM-dependent methyltransferase